MTSLPGLPTITVKGPFWSAEVDLVSVTTVPGPIPFLAETFDHYAAGMDPAHWVDTKRNNSFDEDQTLFKTYELDEQIVFGTRAEETNIHSHYVIPGALTWTNYVYTGRMFISEDDGGIGVTFFSRYPEQQDSYYRLRTTTSKRTFHIAPHPHGQRTVDQTKFDSGVTPHENTWYRFHIEVEDTGERTNIRAKIWAESSPEPAEFQIDTFDASPDRLRSGTVGVWAGHDGRKYFDNLQVYSLASSPLRLASLGTPLLAENFDTYGANQHPTGWVDTAAHNSFDVDDDLFTTRRIKGNIAFGTVSQQDNVHSHYHAPGVLTWTNYAFSGRMYVDDGASVGVTFFSRYPEKRDDYYRLRAYEDRPTFHIAPHPHNIRKVDQAKFDSGVKPKKRTWYRFYLEVEDDGKRTNIRAKVWEDGTAEPGSFPIDTFDDSADRLRSGTIGVWSGHRGKSYYDDLLVQPLVHKSPALRTLFLDQQPRSALGADAVLLPGTLIALCLPKSVTIRPTTRANPDYRWTHHNPPALDDLSIDHLRMLLNSGELCLMLLQADPAAWPQQSGSLPDFTCISGEINLDLLRPRGNNRDALYRALVLEEAALGERPSSTALRGKLTVHSSGATLYGSVHLPWLPAGERVAAPFQLARTIAPDAAGNAVLQTRYRLSIERERLTRTEEAAWIRVWRALSILVNPRNPLHGRDLEDAVTTIWSTLELANPLHVPHLFWQIDEWGATAQLHFAAGEINLLLSDRHPYSQETPPTTLATIASTADIPFTPSADGKTLILTLTAGPFPTPLADGVTYTADLATQHEQIVFPPMALAFDPVETPRFLRSTLNRPTPETIDDPGNNLVQEPLLWGFAPLADGWAQLPVPNMTEQIYFQAADRSKANTTAESSFTSPPRPILQGAVAFGNSYVDTLAAYPAEQAWNLTLTGAQAVQGQWRLARETETDPFVLTRVRVQIVDAEIIANGFFWLSTAAPTAADALPDLSNWVTSLHQLPLRSVRRTPDASPPIVQVNLDAFTISLRDFQLDAFAPPSAHLGSWAFTYHIDDAAIATVGKAGVFITKAIRAHPPLLWRRHPTLPTIQALPLTQTLTPPNVPIASRQLAPYQLAKTPMAWRFGVTRQLADAFSAATQWPQAQSDFAPAAEWLDQHDLPMVALTLPGLYFDPDSDLPQSGLQDATETHLSIRYRYDLPYTDELNALAQTPKTPRDPNEVSPLPDATPPKPAQPLKRTTLLNHWTRLAEQASLASVAAADAIILHNEQVTVQRLIEPLRWPVAATLNLGSYPGLLTLDNTDAAQSAPLPLTEVIALEGISGRFVEEADNATAIRRTAASTDGGYAVRAGTMQSHVSPAGLRDQRGLVRALSRHDGQNSRLIFTEVTLHGDLKGDATAVQKYRLLSLTEALRLDVPGSADWHFWIKDLPAAAVDATGEQRYHFNRTSVLSPVLKELDDVDAAARTIVAVNDPEAVAREQNYRMGYEWRLGDGTTGNSNTVQPLLLNGLRFFPLTLEDVTVVAGEVTQLALVGRLQLPLQDGAELADLNNAVRLIFTSAAQPGPAALALTDLQVESPVVEWPLQLAAGEQTNAPRIEWRTIRLDAEQIVIGTADVTAADATRCRFVLFGQEWSVPLGELIFHRENGTVTEAAYDFNQTTEIRTIIPQRLAVALSLTDGEHSATLDLLIRAGINKQPSLQATVRFMLVGPAGSSMAPVTLIAATLFDRLRIDTADQPIQYVPEALQFVWQGCMTDDIEGALQFLPGMRLQPATCPGFLALTFVAQSPSATANGIRIPPLRLTSAFTETLLAAQWGVFRQRQPGEAVAATEQAQQLFGSSAGEIFIGYTAQWMATDEEPDLDGGRWIESFLLNGFLEVTNLISWPAHMRFDEAAKQLTLPAIATDGALAHLRHTIRILLNQHDLPAHFLIRENAVGTAGAAPYVFALSPDQAWQFLAVVEHQLLEVHLAAPTDAGDEQPVPTPTATYPWEHRWTALQEVRLVAPSRYSAFLADDRTQVIDPVAGIAPRWTLYGHYQASWVKRLTDASSPDALQHLAAGVILVEASAPHWLRTKSVETLLAETMQETTGNTSTDDIVLPTLSGTTLQFLPNGSQAAILSGLDDFGPSAPTAPEWQLLTMPFLGRLQDLQLDGIRTTPVGEPMTADATAKTVHPLHVDPLLQLWRLVQGTSQSISPLVPMLTSWAMQTELVLAFSELEHPVGRTWSRLDPLSLEENWFRLQNPPAEPRFDRLGSIMAALPDTPARLSRATALAKAFDAFRAFYPPPRVVATAALVQPEAARRAAAAQATLLWREESILVWQVGVRNSSENAFVYPWLPVGIQIGAGALRAPATAVQHHAAATLLPARLQSNGKANPTPVSFAVSPYLGLAHHPAPGDATLFLASLELLGLDAASAALRPIASQLHEERDAAELQRWAAQWGAENRQRLRPDSPLGIIRLRQLLSSKRTSIRASNGTSGASEPSSPSSVRLSPLVATYNFVLIEQEMLPSALTQRVVALRSPIRELRFREGQYGGSIMPQAIMPYEIAPPLTTGVQAVYLIPPENGATEPAATASWPWGISALTVGVQYTGSKPGGDGQGTKVGITGKAPVPFSAADPMSALPYTLWWHVPHHQIQFRSAIADMGPVAGLPPFFRAQAIKSLLPALAQLPFPSANALDASDTEEALTQWQPVLPGALRYLLVGARSGAMLAIRNQLWRQRGLAFGESNNGDVAERVETFGSGSVPVQHRVPRPTPLPANRPRQEEYALQPWASYFQPTQNIRSGEGPLDEAFFAACGDHAVLTWRSINKLAAMVIEQADNGNDAGGAEPTPLFTEAQLDALKSKATILFNTAANLFKDFPVEIDERLRQIVRTEMAPTARGILMDVIKPQLGMVPSTWNGDLVLHLAFEDDYGDIRDWEIMVYLVDGDQRLYFTKKESELKNELPLSFVVPNDIKGTEQKRRKLTNILGNKQPGDLINVQADVRPASKLSDPPEVYPSDFRQTLTFSLRIVDEQQLRLPLAPCFTLFEDPQYNRRLASLAGRVTQNVQVNKAAANQSPELVLQSVALVTDRREYNPDSVVALRYDWDNESLQESSVARVSFQRVDRNNTPFDLQTPPDLDQPDNPRFGALKTGATTLLRFSLADFVPVDPKQPTAFRPGETLQITLRFEQNRNPALLEPVVLTLNVNIVAEPVIPMPEAAYALLRHQEMAGQTAVECVRFAWGPEASRIDLICPDDLTQEIVRRRAVFKWQDSVRLNGVQRYGVQKVAQNGATHFLAFD